MRPSWGICASVVVLLALFFTLSQSARAGVDVITFEGLPDYTNVTNQYAAQGLVFGISPQGGGWIPPVIFPEAAGVPQSGTHVLSITHGGGEFYQSDVWGHFTIARKGISMFVGDLGATTHDVSLTTYSADGTQLGQTQVTVRGGAGIHTPLSMQFFAPSIAFFRVTDVNPGADPFPHVAIDDLTFDTPDTPLAPDFAINPSFIGNVQLIPGGSTSVQFILERLNLSTGSINLSLSGLPSGVNVSMANSTNGIDGSLIVLGFSAPLGTLSGGKSVTLTGTPSSPSAGTASHSVQFNLIVVGNYELRVKGIELTQGTQNFGVPSRGTDPSAPITYSGVQLGAEGANSLVRVFADAAGIGPLDPSVSAGVLLHEFDGSGQEVNGSPFVPLSGPATLIDSGSATVTLAEQLDANASFDFQTYVIGPTPRGPFSYRAEILPPVPRFDHSETSVECSTSACATFLNLTMTGITSTLPPQAWVYIDPVLLRVDGQADPPDPITAFAMASLITPVGMDINPSYVGVVNITNYAGENFSDRTSDSLEQLDDWWEDVGGEVGGGPVPAPYFTIGVTGQLDLGATTSEDDHPYAVTFAGRPLTSVAHELHHCFGRMHASSACGATGSQAGEAWPPDEQGFLNGVGMDLRGPAPFKILATGVAGLPVNTCLPSQPGQWYDFMSYCQCANSGDPDSLNTWISPKGWDEFWNNPNPQNLGGAPSMLSHSMAHTMVADPANQPAPAPVGETLRVRAYVSGTGVHIAIVKKVPNGRAFAPPASSAYHLLVRDGDGRTITEIAMITKEVIVMHRQVVIWLNAEVPTKPGIESVAITKDSRVVAERVRPQQLPQVTIDTPKVAPTPSNAEPAVENMVQVQWKAAAFNDKNPVTATIDYSRDDGRTWRPLYKGPNSNQLQLPQYYFAGTAAARVRVRIYDGFNEVSAVSNSFTTPNLPPTVRILKPSASTKVRSGVPVQLIGKAVDENMKPISGKSLRWLRSDVAIRGDIFLGTGDGLVVSSLPPGRNLIRLEASDAQGRVGIASMEVVVAANPPQFFVLDAPRVVSRTANQVAIRVASSIPATLTFHETVVPSSLLRDLSLHVATPAVTPAPTPAPVPPPSAAGPPPSLQLLIAHVPTISVQPPSSYQVGPQPTTITLSIPTELRPLYLQFSLQAEGGTTSRLIAIGRD